MDESSYLSPTVTEEDVSSAMEKYLHAKNMNWGEVHSISDLYSVCDIVSATFNGLPDSILKPAMQAVIRKHTELAESDWMRDHLMQIAKIWADEVHSGKPYLRDTRVVMKAPIYEPYGSEKPRKRKKEHYKNGRNMLSVSALLQTTKFALCTSNGNVAVEEDENGNFTLNGEKLTFDSWSRVTKTDDSITASVAKNFQIPAELLRSNLWIGNDYVSFKRKQDKIQATNDTAINNRVSQRAQAKNLSYNTTLTSSSSAAKQFKELDEGEIDSEEERQMDKQKKTKILSSSSEDSDDGFVNARRRRSLLRKTRKSGDSSNLSTNQTLAQFFAYRHQLVITLPLSQKQKFVSYLKMAVNRENS